MHFQLAVLTLVGIWTSSSFSQSLEQALSSNSDLSSLSTILQDNPSLLTNLSSWSPVTVFAPSNAALDAINLDEVDSLTRLISYHFIANQTLRSDQVTQAPQFFNSLIFPEAQSIRDDGCNICNIGISLGVISRNEGAEVVVQSGFKNEAVVVSPDIEFDGGIIHIIDNVLTLPLNLVSLLNAGPTTRTFAGLVNSSDPFGPLPLPHGVAIFAPNDMAFQSIASVLSSDDVSQEDLAAIANYHAVFVPAPNLYENPTLASPDLAARDGEDLETLSGATVRVRVDEDGAIFINQARIVNADNLFDYGVVHILDSVLNANNSGVEPSDEPVVAFEDVEGSSEQDLSPFTEDLEAPSTTASALAEETSAVWNTSAEATAVPADNAAAASMVGNAAVALVFGLASWIVL